MLLAFTALNSNASTVSNLIDSATATTKSIVNSTVNGAVDAKNFVDTSGNFRLMYNDLKSGVLALATAFKTGAEQVLYIIGKKYFLMGIYAWVTVLGGIILLFFGISRFYKLDFKKLTDDDTPLSAVYFFTGLTGLLFGVFLITNNLQDAINYTFNPEYYVLQEVIDMVKTLKQ